MAKSAQSASDELLSTKLVPPRPPAGALLRAALLERLEAGLDRRLTLIAAPAGFGKTTLAARRLAGCPFKQPLEGVGQIAQQVPAVSDLNGVRRAVPGAIGIGPARARRPGGRVADRSAGSAPDR